MNTLIEPHLVPVRAERLAESPVLLGRSAGDEVDLVLERADGIVIGVEVKAADHVDGKQFAGLRKLRDRLGPLFAAGLAFHLGQVGYQAEDRLHSIPVDHLWT